MSDRPDIPNTDFGINFISLARKWRQALNIELAKEGLTDTTWAPLVRLATEGDGITQVELAAKLGLDASSLVRHVDMLEQRDLIARQIDPADRRLRRIVLTEAGRVELVRIYQHIHQTELRFLSEISKAEQAMMMQMFRQIDARIDATMAQSPSL